MNNSLFTFQIPLEVRDYELDLQGIVNNAVYNHYFEHTRHQFLKHHELDFAQLHNEGLDAVVVQMTTKYKRALKSGDSFVSKLYAVRKGRLRIVFFQSLFLNPCQSVVASSEVEVACVFINRPVEPLAIVEKLQITRHFL